MSDYDYDAIIIGSGPSGIAVATGLIRAGITNIIMFEREADAGGVPRHTKHPSFGLLVFKRPTTGPAFIKRIRKRCPDLQIETSTTITALRPGGEVDIVSPKGRKTLRARHVILATGARETPRHARLISGLRPQGVITTGALQQFVYLSDMKPFTKAVIVGTELASFSALWTMRHAGIKPVAMIEENSRVTAYLPAVIFARLMGVPIHYQSHVVDVSEVETLSQIEIENSNGKREKITCDGVMFSGKFTGDNNLARASHLALNQTTGIPLIDQDWRSSDPDVSVVGNTTHPADMGDQCYLEGLSAGKNIARHLQANKDASGTRIPITHGTGIKMTTPNVARLDDTGATQFTLFLHVTQAYKGPISVVLDGKVLYQKTHACLPARRIKLKNIRVKNGSGHPDHKIEIILGQP